MLKLPIQTSVVAWFETQCDWSFVKHGHHFLDALCSSTTKIEIASDSITKQIHQDQKGGTAIAGLGCIFDILAASGSDPTGLGRLSWIRVGFDQTWPIIIRWKPGKASLGRMVWEEHIWYFQSIGDFRDPATILIDMILIHISSWQRHGYEIILTLDSNQDVYTWKLAHLLQRAGLNMSCLFESA